MIAGHAKGWTRHRLKFVADINAATLPENTDPDWQFDYVDISRVTQGIITDDPQPTTFAQAPVGRWLGLDPTVLAVGALALVAMLAAAGFAVRRALSRR